MTNPASKASYKSYCFEHDSHIMFFYYNHNHPIMTKNYKFELGRVKIFTAEGRVLACQLTSNPHLNLSLDWNEEYFAKLFHGLARFQLEGSGDDDDDSLSLLVRDHFEDGEEIFLMRAKLADEFGAFDLANDFWHVFKNYNAERMRALETMAEENADLARKADEHLLRLVALQDRKEQEKERLKGQLSALLREKENKLKEFNENFKFFAAELEIDASLDPEGQKETMSIAGSLFQDSQEFVFPS
jgi:hypothetical protein